MGAFDENENRPNIEPSAGPSPPVPDPRAVAVAESVQKYRGYLRRFVAMHMDPRLRMRFDPSDVIQQASLELSQQAAHMGLDGTGVDRSTLRQKALFVLISFVRRFLVAAKRTVALETPLVADDEVHCWDAQAQAPDEIVETEELVSIVTSALGRLDPSEQEVLRLRHTEGLRNTDAAERLGISPDAARKRYGRAILRLREESKVVDRESLRRM